MLDLGSGAGNDVFIASSLVGEQGRVIGLDMTEEIAIMSLKYDGVQKVRQLRPDWDIGLLSAQVVGNMGNLDVDFLAVNMAMATPTFIRNLVFFF